MGRPAITTTDAVLLAIHACFSRKGYPPTVEEIRQEIGVGSPRTVIRYLALLEREGRLKRWPGARGMRIMDPPRGTCDRCESEGVLLLVCENCGMRCCDRYIFVESRVCTFCEELKPRRPMFVERKEATA